jgi:hypothetical protein
MTSSTVSATVPLERVVSVMAITALLTWLGDFLFWNHPPGVSIGIYIMFVVAALMPLPGEEQPTRAACIAAFLLFCSAWASFLETSFSNVAVLIGLLAVLMGERHYQVMAGGWTRWSESFVAWGCAPGRWWWLARNTAESELGKIGMNTVSGDRVVKGIQILAPAGLLAIVFGVVLSWGNAVFRQMLAHLDATFVRWIESIDFSPARIFLWLVLATFSLALIRPRPAPEKPRLWTRAVPRIARGDVTIAVWQSCAVFLVLNAMFFVVNTIDLVYLWGGNSRMALPEHVTFSEFVHQGVYSLIFAVVLSAVVIALIFQQASNVTQHRVLKVLAWAWIVQNLLLIAGVFLRLKLYVDAYQLSELRVYVGCFLLLVTTGFALLAWHIARGENFGTLLWRNVVATFVLFFLVQFPDVSGWVARTNLKQWQRDPSRTLDLAYLELLGPGGWPALCELAESGKSTARHAETNETAREMVLRLAAAESDARFSRDWRSYQWRRSMNGARLIGSAARLSAAQ